MRRWSIAVKHHHEYRLTPSLDVNSEAVREYWETAGKSAHADGAAAASYMAHEQELPASCIAHRTARERLIVERIIRQVRSNASVPQDSALRLEGTVVDFGCGAGEWTAYFAERATQVVGIEQSSSMCAAACERTAGHANARIICAAVADYRIEGEVDLAFLGGIMMYLNRDAAVSLLKRIAQSLSDDGMVLARESTIPVGEMQGEAYPVIYRSVARYTDIAREAGLSMLAVHPNDGYRHMEIVCQLVAAASKLKGARHLPSELVARGIWQALSHSGGILKDTVPSLMGRIGWTFPKLSNHFFVLRRSVRR